MENFQTVRGVKDLLPEELGKMRFVEKQATLVCKNACYEEISVPIFEFAELFEKPLGETSDIVTKENYVFQDRSNNTLICLLYTSPSPRDPVSSRMPSSA